jgi:hypothetical protein
MSESQGGYACSHLYCPEGVLRGGSFLFWKCGWTNSPPFMQELKANKPLNLIMTLYELVYYIYRCAVLNFQRHWIISQLTILILSIFSACRWVTCRILFAQCYIKWFWYCENVKDIYLRSVPLYFVQIPEVDEIQDAKWSLVHHWREHICANFHFRVIVCIEFHPLQSII